MHLVDKFRSTMSQESTDEHFRRNVLIRLSIALSSLLMVGTLIRYFASTMLLRIFVVNCLISVAFALTPVFCWKSNNPNLMAYTFFVGFIVLIVNGGLVAGGVNAPVVALLPLFPVFGFCFGGKKLGVVGLLVSFSLVAFLLIAEKSGWIVSAIDPATISAQRAAILVTIVIASFAVGLTYESSRHRTERRLVEISRLASLGTLAGGIAHEVNNPLTILVGYANQLDLIGKKGKEIDPLVIEKLAGKIETSAYRISKIVSGLRTYARDETGEPFAEVRLKNIVNGAIALCGERFKNANIVVKLSIISDESLHAKTGQAIEVVLNLLNNAYDAVLGQDTRWIEVSSKNGSEFIELYVTDSGQGIPVRLQTKIFAPFFTTKEIGKGIGLGLSTSSSIMQQHGGEIIFDASSPHTRFVLRFKKYKSISVPGEVAS